MEENLLELLKKISERLDSKSINDGLSVLQRIDEKISDVRTKVENIAEKLEKNIHETTVNTETMKTIKENVTDLKKQIKDDKRELEKKIIDSKTEAVKTAKRDVMLRIYTSMTASFGAFITAVLTIYFNFKK